MKKDSHLFSHHQYWAKRFGVAPVLPMSRKEMDQLGWDSCDIIIVTGDAYIDHPSFGMALIGRLLESQGFRVGIISQPDWHSADDFKKLGQPNLFFGITAGNMDSMVNRYTADRKIRSDDAYTPNNEPNKRPDRATIVYSQRCREAYSSTPIVIGGIEASLRRIAHYDYWSDNVRHSILLDSKADILLYGNAERAVVEFSHRLAKGEDVSTIVDLRGSVVLRKNIPDSWCEIDKTILNNSEKKIINSLTIENACCDQQSNKCQGCQSNSHQTMDKTFIRLPSFEQVRNDEVLYAHATRQLYLESNPYCGKTLVQKHRNREVWINPPPIPLTTKEMDKIYELPYSRLPHSFYDNAKIPAYEMIRFSVIIMRGCFGGCSFCSITAHEGRIIQNRSQQSVLKEIEEIRDKTPGFTGIISDLGGPTANMYQLKCRNSHAESVCRRFSCVYPTICKNLETDHRELIELYQKARSLPGIKKVLIGSGVRYDLAIKSPAYIRELASHHVGGYLKIAPEHIAKGPLSKMMKPGIETYDQFKILFDQFSKENNKEQYLIPYFIAAHPGTTDEDMLELALWLKANNFRLDKVQNFIPTPMTLATSMYYSSCNPLKDIKRDGEKIHVPKKLKIRQLHKAFLRYHDPKNWPILREALNRMGRSDLIGKGKQCLVPRAADLKRRFPQKSSK